MAEEIEDHVPRARVGAVLHPVADVSAAVRFYRDAFGFVPRYTDGDRYAAIDGGGTTLALAGPPEDVTGGVPAVMIAVPEVAAALRTLSAAGGVVSRGPEQGPHEIRAVARDPWGNMIVVYGPR